MSASSATRIARHRPPRLLALSLATAITFGLLTSSLAGAESTPRAASGASSSAPATAPPASTKSRATFGIAPITLGKNDARGYFSYQMGVGGSYSDKVQVINYGSTPLVLTVYAADLDNGDDGSVVAGLPGVTFTDAGGWIKLAQPQQTVTVPATTAKQLGRVVLPFRVQVPNNAAPGDHGAALIAVLTTYGKNAKSENVRLNQRLASRIYLRVAGPLHPAMAIEGLKVKYTGTDNPVGKGGATVSYTVHNTGNVRLSANQQVQVSGLFGGKAKLTQPAPVALLFPGAKQPVTVKVSGILPTVFEHAKVLLNPTLFTDQTPEPLAVTRASASFTAVPWSVLGVLLLICLAAVCWVLLRRRAGHRPLPPGGSGRHARPDDPKGPGGPSAMPRPLSENDPKVTTR